MKARQWLIGWLALSLIPIGILAFLVYRVDPFFHFTNIDDIVEGGLLCCSESPGEGN